MKICQIPASRLGTIENERTLKISPTLQLLFGFVDADTTAIRNGIRYFFYGQDRITSGLEFDRTELEVSMESGSSIGTRFADGIRMRNDEVMAEWNKLLQEVDIATFQSFFELNFGDAETSGAQICYQLNRRFNAPFGDVSVDDPQQGRSKLLKVEIAAINNEIDGCRHESEKLRSRLEELESQHNRSYEFEVKQKQTLGNRIAKLGEKLNQLKSSACQLEDEIELTLSSVVPSDRQSVTQSEKLNSDLSSQIASIDAQIERWKQVKMDVDGRLIQVKGDLSCSRIGEFDDMFEDVRMINRIGETKLLGLLENTNANDSVQAVFRELIELNHQICDGLTHVQDHWRDEIAKGEIDSLKRCSNELTGYVDRLTNKRTRLLGSGCGHSASSRCQCKSHRAQARVDMQRVEQMKRQLSDLLAEIDVTERNLTTAKSELLQLESNPDSQNEIQTIRERILVCNEDHSMLQDEKDRLLNQLRKVLEAEKLNSRLVRLISMYAKDLTDGSCQRVYLQQDGHDLVLIDGDGVRKRFEESDFVTRSRIRMAVSLGCARLLADSGYSFPLVWEDPFVGFESSDVELAVTVLREYSRSVGQIILMTNNRFVRQLFESKSIPCLDIPDRFSGDVVPGQRDPGRRSGWDNREHENKPESSSDTATTERQTRTMRGRSEYSSRTDWTDINRDFDVAAMDQYGSEAYQYRSDMGSRSRYSSNRGNSSHSSSSSRTRQVSQGDSDSNQDTRYRSGYSSRSGRSSGSYSRSSSSPNSSPDTGSSSSSQSRSNSGARSGSGSYGSSSRSNRQYSTRRSDRITSGRQSDRRESTEHSEENFKYYLELSSRVEAAPTIGPKTAERLEKIGICTVSDLIEMDAETIAEKLGQRRIKTEDVADWQKQALLVCEVPNLRGHDAQILVACDINDAVQLAGMDAESLYEVVGPFAKSKDGKKLLRGSSQPDLEEVKDWVRWARHEHEDRQAA